MRGPLAPLSTMAPGAPITPPMTNRSESPVGRLRSSRRRCVPGVDIASPRVSPRRRGRHLSFPAFSPSLAGPSPYALHRGPAVGLSGCSTCISPPAQVREIIRGLRPPASGRESYAPPGGTSGLSAYGPPSRACVLLEEVLVSQPEAKGIFLGEGGVLVLLEVLDTDNEKVRPPSYSLESWPRSRRRPRVTLSTSNPDLLNPCPFGHSFAPTVPPDAPLRTPRGPST